MNMQQAIKSVTERRDLNADEMTSVMRTIMTGEATPAQIGGFLIGLRMKGETIEEIAAAAGVMRELASGVKVEGEHIVDIVGTGGDGSNTFNISTASSFVVAAAGGTVAKHGNRSVSSKSGSADLLEAAGVNLELDAEQVGYCIRETGVGFMFLFPLMILTSDVLGPLSPIFQLGHALSGEVNWALYLPAAGGLALANLAGWLLTPLAARRWRL